MLIAEIIMERSVSHVRTDIMSEQKENAFQSILFVNKTVHKETVPHAIQDMPFRAEDVSSGRPPIQIVKLSHRKDVLNVMLDSI